MVDLTRSRNPVLQMRYAYPEIVFEDNLAIFLCGKLRTSAGKLSTISFFLFNLSIFTTRAFFPLVEFFFFTT